MIKFKLSQKSATMLQSLADQAAEPIGRCGAKLALQIQEDSMRSFDPANKGTPDSGYTDKWAQWKPSTRKQYERQGIAKRRAKRRRSSKPITHSLLKMTGRLMGGIVAGYVIEGRTRARVQCGILKSVNYGVHHMEGTPRMVARPFIGLTPRGHLEVIEFIRHEIAMGIFGKR